MTPAELRRQVANRPPHTHTTRIESGQTEALKTIPTHPVKSASNVDRSVSLKQYKRHFDLYGSEMILETAAFDRGISDEDWKHMKAYVNRYAKRRQTKRGSRADFRRRMREWSTMTEVRDGMASVHSDARLTTHKKWCGTPKSGPDHVVRPFAKGPKDGFNRPSRSRLELGTNSAPAPVAPGRGRGTGGIGSHA